MVSTARLNLTNLFIDIYHSGHTHRGQLSIEKSKYVSSEIFAIQYPEWAKVKFDRIKAMCFDDMMI